MFLCCGQIVKIKAVEDKLYLMAIRAVIFDFDEVLIDSYKDHLDAFVIAAKKFHINLDKPDIKKICHRFGKSAKEIMKEVKPEMTDKELNEFAVEKDKVYRVIVAKRGIKLMKGAKNLLEFLAKTKLEVAIASSASRRNINLALKKTGTGKFFDLIISAEDTKRHKPHPDPLVKAAKILRVKTKECIYVGDSVYEIISAKRAKMIGIGVTTGNYSADDLERNGAKKVFRNLLELKNFLEYLQ